MRWQRFVRGETHVLALYPHLLLQQAVQQDPGTVLARSAEARLVAESGRRPWIRRLNRGGDTPGCLLTLSGGKELRQLLAVEPNGRWLVVRTSSTTVKLFDYMSGTPLAELRSAAELTKLVVAPCGRWVLATERQGAARIWAIPEGNPLGAVEGHETILGTPAFSPDGSRFVLASLEGKAEVRSVAAIGSATALEGSSGVERSWAFSRDARRVAGGGPKGELLIWDSFTGALLGRRSLSDRILGPLEFSADDTYLFCGCLDGATYLLDSQSLGVLRTFRGHLGARREFTGVFKLRLAMAGRRLITSGYDGNLRVWDTASGSELAVIEAEWVGNPPLLALSADGSRFATARAREVWLMDAESGRETGRFQAHGGPVTELAFGADSDSLVSSADLQIRLWSVRAALAPAPASHPGGLWPPGPWFGRFSPDGRRIAVAADQKVRVLDLDSGAELLALEGGPGFEFAPKGELLVTPLAPRGAEYQGVLAAWSLRNGRRISTVHRGGMADWSFELSSDGRHALTVARDNTVHIWELASGSEIHPELSDDKVHQAHFMPDASSFLSLGRDAMVRIREIESGRETSRFAAWDETSITISPDGKRLALFGRGGRPASLWSLEGARALVSLEHDEWVAHQVVFSPDSALLVSNAHGAVRVWRSLDGSAVGPLADGDAPLDLIEFSPDGGHLLCGSRDGFLRIFRVADRACVARFYSASAVIAVRWNPTRPIVLAEGQGGATHLLRLEQSVEALPSVSAIGEGSEYRAGDRS